MNAKQDDSNARHRPAPGDTPRTLGLKLATLACIWEPSAEHAAIADDLLAAGADVKVQDDQGCTALLNASQAGNARLVEKLLAKGADPHASDNRTDHLGPAICHAAYRRSPETLRLLLKAGADPNAQEPTAGRSALFLAINYSRGDADGDAPESVKVLIEAGANPDIPTFRGWTPLLDCFDFQFPAPETAKYLLQHGADPALKTVNTPYDMAKRNHPEIAQIILDMIAEREEAARAAAETQRRHEKWLNDGCPTTETATPMRRLQLRPKA